MSDLSALGPLARRYRVLLDGTLEVLVPGGKGPNSKEGFEICALCGQPFPVSQLALIKGRYYCIPNRHAEEKL